MADYGAEMTELAQKLAKQFPTNQSRAEQLLYDALKAHKESNLVMGSTWRVLEGYGVFEGEAGQLTYRQTKFPPSSKTINADNGWLDPKGTFYGCRYSGHSLLAYELGYGDERDLEQLGWLKVQCNDFHYPLWLTDDKMPSQRQIDAITDRCLELKQDLPSWLEYELAARKM